LQTAYRITQLWRYPVASIGGETVASADISRQGIWGDRTHGLFDATSGSVAAPEKDRRWHKALLLSASLDETNGPVISFPDGMLLSIEDERACECLSEYFGFDVGIGRIDPGSLHRQYPRIEHRHKHFPLHVLTTGSLKHLARLRGVEKTDVRRFRPNILVEPICREPAKSSFEETIWVGRRAQIGPVGLTIEEEATRCGITIIPQSGIEDDPEILRTILRNNKRRFGAYCSVQSYGTLNIGDGFRLL
jgi:uncharacterized protein